MKNKLILGALALSICSFAVGRITAPKPPVLKNETVAAAKAWCTKTIASLPDSSPAKATIKQSLDDLNSGNIAWTINPPAGAGISHALVPVLAQANAAQESSEQLEEVLNNLKTKKG